MFSFTTGKVAQGTLNPHDGQELPNKQKRQTLARTLFDKLYKVTHALP